MINLLYIVGYDSHKKTLDVLDTDDGVVQTITKTEFVNCYNQIKDLVQNNFYTDYLESNLYKQKYNIKKMELSGFDIYDRNNLTKEPALRVLLRNLGVYDYRSLSCWASAYDYTHKDFYGNEYEFSFCRNILDNNKFDCWYKYFQIVVDAFNATSITFEQYHNFNYEIKEMCFYYTRDYLLHSSSVRLSPVSPFLGLANISRLVDSNNSSYTIEFKSPLYAKFFFFALIFCDELPNTQLKDWNIIELLSEPLYHARNELGSIHVNYLHDNFMNLSVNNYKPMSWITKNYVLNRGGKLYGSS